MSLMMGAGFVVNAAVQRSVNSDNNCDAKDANFLSIEEFARLRVAGLELPILLQWGCLFRDGVVVSRTAPLQGLEDYFKRKNLFFNSDERRRIRSLLECMIERLLQYIP